MNRTKDDAIEFVSTLMRVREEDPTGLQNGEELRLPGLRQRGEEGVAALGDPLLQHSSVVRHSGNLLHVHEPQPLRNTSGSPYMTVDWSAWLQTLHHYSYISSSRVHIHRRREHDSTAWPSM